MSAYLYQSVSVRISQRRPEAARAGVVRLPPVPAEYRSIVAPELQSISQLFFLRQSCPISPHLTLC